MLDNRVRARKHQARMTVVETNQVRRLPARPANLDDLARPFRLAHDVATHMEPVSDGCLHPPPPHPRSRATRPPEVTLTAWHLATTSIHLDADGSSSRLCGNIGFLELNIHTLWSLIRIRPEMITDPPVAQEMAAKVERLLDENLVSAASRRELDALWCAIAITRRY
jgi:hypothetical protein